MDVWGTHITISTTVGGMKEQQIIFKSCVLNTTEIRIVARRQYGERNDSVRTGFTNHDINGEWIQPSGCSKLANKCEHYTGTWYVYLCSGCDVQCLLNQYGKPTFCKCSCPVYPPDPEAKPYQPYC